MQAKIFHHSVHFPKQDFPHCTSFTSPAAFTPFLMEETCALQIHTLFKSLSSSTQLLSTVRETLLHQNVTFPAFASFFCKKKIFEFLCVFPEKLSSVPQCSIFSCLYFGLRGCSGLSKCQLMQAVLLRLAKSSFGLYCCSAQSRAVSKSSRADCSHSEAELTIDKRQNRGRSQAKYQPVLIKYTPGKASLRNLQENLAGKTSFKAFQGSQTQPNTFSWTSTFDLIFERRAELFQA